MKRVICGFLFVVLFSFSTWLSSGLELNEVMPDCGNLSANCEFIELYSREVVDLKGYVLDTQGQKLNLNVSFQGYLVITKHKNAFVQRFGLEAIEWKGMGLANDGDTVALLKEGGVVDSFTYQKVDKNTTWQKIGEWKKCSPTPFKENYCPPSQQLPELPANKPPQPILESTTPQDPQSSSKKDNISAPASQSVSEEIKKDENIVSLQENKSAFVQEITRQNSTELIETEVGHQIILLTGKNIKTIYSSKNEKIQKYAIYGFAFFCILLIILLMMKRDRGVV